VIRSNLEVGELFAKVGLVLLVLTFIGMAVMAVLAAIVEARNPSRRAVAGGLPLGAILSAILKAIPDLIKTPGGIAALLAILGVVQLLGIAAIESGQLSDGPLASEPSAPPGPTAPSLPEVTGSPSESPDLASPTP
jgi:hypothetical protein